MMKKLLVIWIAAIFALTLGAAAPAQASEKEAGSFDLSTAIIKVAQKNIPAVAHIEVTERQEVANPLLPFQNDPFFRRFFDIPKMPRKFKRELKGLGSGMIIDPQGHILTNHHVAGGATKLEVLLSDGRRFPAKLVGTDPKTDLAVIKIDAQGPLPTVTFADSDKVEVGEWVVAIGHPQGLDQTVTQGIISAKHRRGVTDPNSFQDFMQTDAAINPGNSGGPLLNLRGEVIGVNAAIASQSGGFEGIGFTIPSNMATYVSKALIAHGKVIRGWLGVTVRDLTPDLAKSLHADVSKGAVVVEVVKGSPADYGGLKKDDVIVAYREKEVSDSPTLRNEVANSPLNQDVKMTVLRDGHKVTLTAKIINLEDSIKVLEVTVDERMGVRVRDVNTLEANKFGIEPNQGVVITWLDPKGPLREAGFEIDDIILAIDNQPIKGREGFVTLVNMIPHKQKIAIMALDHRSGNTGMVEVVVR